MNSKMHQCSECKKSYTSKQNLEIHKRIHSGIKPYRCVHCNKCFAQMSSLKHHSKYHVMSAATNQENRNSILNDSNRFLATNSNKQNTACAEDVSDRKNNPACKGIKMVVSKHAEDYHCKIIRNEENNNEHIQPSLIEDSVATTKKGKPSKTHRCKVCHKSFSTKNTLKTHYRIHTGERPFRCKECAQCFIQATSLKWHLKTRHVDVNHTKYSCNECGQSFRSFTKLKKHRISCCSRSSMGGEKRPVIALNMLKMNYTDTYKIIGEVSVVHVLK